MGEIDDVVIPHLRSQFDRARPILFTGAGFSRGARNILGNPIPLPGDLRHSLWQLCFPGKEFSGDDSLQDLYEEGRLRHGTRLKSLLEEHLTVDTDSLPDWYQTFFSFPWKRYFTLNIDNLLPAVQRKFDLPRPIACTSATSPTAVTIPADPAALEAVHLNGVLADLPEHVTFSETQYAERLGRSEPSYVRLAADLMVHPFVFIGTTLNEPPLWQHLELRHKRGGRDVRELRPKSYLVTPSVPLARRSLLSEFNIVWLSMDAEEFEREVLQKLLPAASKGLSLILASRTHVEGAGELQEVAALATDPFRPNDFLIGQEPIWADLQSGRAIPREIDERLGSAVDAAMVHSGLRGVIVVTGTAGSGKSTALMRACLRLSSAGYRVGWVDRDSELSAKNLKRALKVVDAPPVLAIDDADIYGGELSPMLRELCRCEQNPLLLVALRAGKIEKVFNPIQLKGVPFAETVMPPLADRDIGALLGVLDRENRLGVLKGRSRTEQEQVFREKAGRQLLVAMIEATSGRRFEERAIEELEQLDQPDKTVYATIAVASALRYSLSREDVLVALGDQTNEALNVIERLLRRHIISTAALSGSSEPAVRARHRVIASIIFDELQRTRQLDNVIWGLALVAAAKVSPLVPRTARAFKFLRTIINHDFLQRTVGVDYAKNLYGYLESLLPWDFHYWLQRGSLEVEFGDLGLAENFLGQARGLASDSALVDTEWAFFLFKKALEHPAARNAKAYVDEAREILFSLIERRGDSDAYPFHVLGSQGLSWARRGIPVRTERDIFLRVLISSIEKGLEKHPRATDLKQLLLDLRKEQLAVSTPEVPSK